jgi:flagellar hook protein FlgE
VTGGAYDPLTGTVGLTLAGGPLDLNIGLLNDPTGMTQLSDTFAPTSVTKNGFPVSNLTTVEVDSNGFVYAFFETGRSTRVYQVPLVDVPNPNGLESLDSQTYGLSLASGSMFIWDAGDGPTGEIVGFAREESTTDLATELTGLIQTQRAYSSNAKVIQTVDEMLQETTNIKR